MSQKENGKVQSDYENAMPIYKMNNPVYFVYIFDSDQWSSAHVKLSYFYHILFQKSAACVLFIMN